MKSLIIAAAVAALALPALAAENDKAAAQPQVEKTTPAKEKQQAAKKAETEKLASEGISTDVTLVNGASTPGNGASKPEERTSLRFQSWVHDEDNEHGY
jgi:hypothetical protein